MKKILLAFSLFISFFSFKTSKASPGLDIDKITRDGIVLNQGWKFHAGDNKEWSRANFYDNNWGSIDPSAPIGLSPQIEAAQFGWFRLTLSIGKSLRDKTIALAITQTGASEIYFDGVLIRQYGTVSRDYDCEQTYDPKGEPLTVELDDRPVHVLAVRYSYNKRNLYAGNGMSVFSAYLARPADASDNFVYQTNAASHRAFRFGVFLLLGILHLFIYLSHKTRKVNLYLSLYAFCQAFVFVDGLFAPLLHSNAWALAGISTLYVGAPITFMLLLFTVYTLFNRDITWWFSVLLTIGVLIIPFEFWKDIGQNQVLLSCFIMLIYIEIIRISILAYRKKQQGSVLFLWGQSITLFFYFLFNYIYLFYDQPYSLLLIERDIAFVTPAIIISILLAHEFAENNISLKLQLIEVKKLSEKAISQELEKQQLLASQNEMLEKKVDERTNDLKQSLSDLKSTQAQLVQREKMASLGELTAGIAHEIQNPLNFVNNFSEVNKELIDEMQLEIAKGDLDEVKAIANDISENEQKINLHGKRADAIVKGMLQHSQTGKGTKQPTDINALAQERMGLSYHAMQSKNPDFNSELATSFDAGLPKISLIPQDIGKVLLNVFNNAFYAVNQKQKTAGTDYRPEVSVTTTSEKNSIIIRVKDNGTGIPENIKDKIMQPFFTTKPTGEGTGLGLSLTYDIVVKGHEGCINVNSTEGEGSEFIISIPSN